MMFIRIFTITIVIFFVLGQTSQSSDGTYYTLADCIKKALEENQEIKSRALAVESAEEGIYQAMGDFLPTLGLNYGKTKLDKTRRTTDISQENGEEVDPKIDSQETFSPNRNKNRTLSITQPLFTGFSGIYGLNKARYLKEYREQELLQAQQKMANDVSTSFYDRLRASLLITKLQESIERLEKQQRIVGAWVKLELAPALRLIEVNVDISDARYRLIKAMSDKDVATVKLKELMVLEPEQSLELVGNLDVADQVTCSSLLECQDLALKQRSELVQSTLGIAMAEQDAHSILSKNMPQANFSASWVDSKTDYSNPVQVTTEASYTNEEREYYSAGFNISFHPFQGGREIFEWRKQRKEIERLMMQRSRQQQSILTEVNIRFSQVSDNTAANIVAKDSVSAAQAAYQMASRSAELGVVSLKDLLDAENRLTEKEVTLLNSKYNLMIAGTQLYYVLGYRVEVAPQLAKQVSNVE